MKNKRKIFLSVVLPLSSAIAMEGNRQMNNRLALPENMYSEIIDYLPIKKINQMDKLSKAFYDRIVTRGVNLSNDRELERDRNSNQYRNKKIIPTISFDQLGCRQDIQDRLSLYPVIVYSGALNDDNVLGAFNRIDRIFNYLKQNRLNFFYHMYMNRTNAPESFVKLLISNRDMEQLQPDVRKREIEQYKNMHPDSEIYSNKSTTDEYGTLITQNIAYDKQRIYMDMDFDSLTKSHGFHGYRVNPQHPQDPVNNQE